MSDQYFDETVEQLLIDKLTGQISAADDELLSRMLENDEHLRRHWEELQRLHGLSKAVKWEQGFDPEKSWSSLMDKMEKQQPARVVPMRRRWLSVAIAAALLAAIAIPVYRSLQSPQQFRPLAGEAVHLTLPNGKQIEVAQDQILVKQSQPVVEDKAGKEVVDAQSDKIDPGALNRLDVPAGRNFQLQLADGTEVWLNAASHLDFPLQFNKNTREIRLSGEAFFKVAHDASKPFIVSVNGTKVQVLGTEFNVKAYPGENQLASLVRGKVAVRNSTGEQVIIQPGQQALVRQGNTGIDVNGFDETVVLGWMNGMYYFQDQELGEIAQTIQRWFDAEIRFEDSSLAHLHFSGALNKNRPLTDFLHMMSKASGTQYSVEGNRVRFRR